jgi:hypothetical protein
MHARAVSKLGRIFKEIPLAFRRTTSHLGSGAPQNIDNMFGGSDRSRIVRRALTSRTPDEQYGSITITKNRQALREGGWCYQYCCHIDVDTNLLEEGHTPELHKAAGHFEKRCVGGTEFECTKPFGQFVVDQFQLEMRVGVSQGARSGSIAELFGET